MMRLLVQVRMAKVAFVFALICCSPSLLPCCLRTTLADEADAKVKKQPFARDRVDVAMERAIRYLMSEQFSDGDIAGAFNEGQKRQNLTAMTSLSILAMAAAGHQPADATPQGEAMRRGLDFVLRPEAIYRGHYFGNDGSRMYGHGITTLMLAEMLGMGVNDRQDRRIRARLKAAVKLIRASQAVDKDWRSQGGWRYTPNANDSDLSVSVWQVMALRSAKNAGLDVPKESIEAAVEYIQRCYHERHEAFAYTPGGHPEFAMAAAGLLSMQVCGEYKTDEVIGSADWLLERDLNYDHPWFFYGCYYYAQGMYQRGGEHARTARKRVEELLLRRQTEDGSWVGQHGQERHAGKVYTTSMAVLSLSVKHHFLPIYQR